MTLFSGKRGAQMARIFTRFFPRRWRIVSDDRTVLEQTIFPALIEQAGRRRQILFVGCQNYTRWYPMVFDWFSDAVFSTIEPDPACARFGSPKRHTVGVLQDLHRDPSQQGLYDVIVLNGVFGFGIDSPEQKIEAFEIAHGLLKPGGQFLIGYNDIDFVMDNHIKRDKCRTDFGIVDRDKFEPCPIPGLAASDHLTRNNNRHRFVCFRKRA